MAEKEERRMRRLLQPGIILCVSLVLLNACSLGKTTVGTTTAQFTKTPCPFTVSSSLAVGKDVICGTITVPEDHAHPNGRMLHLAVADFKPSGLGVTTDPVIYLSGGPGGRAVGDFGPFITAANRSVFFGNRELILFDQRGTGYSQPSLACTEVNQLQFTNLDKNVAVADAIKIQNAAFQTCHDRLVNNGVNLAEYTSYNDAGDVHDVMLALGLKQANLYGVSYGTRLALQVMRDFPDRVRSVILDATFPPQVESFTSFPTSFARVFATLFAGCTASATCATQHADLENRFYALVQTMNTTPITFPTTDPNTNKGYTVLFKGDDLANLLFQAFYVSPFIKDIPKVIDDVSQGNYGELSNWYGVFNFDTSVSWGMYESVECSEDAPFVTPQGIATAEQAVSPILRANSTQAQDGQLAACQNWHVPAVNATEKTAVTSAIPTLILEGEYDPITPPTNGDLAAQTLSHSFVLRFPGLGHGVYFSFLPCPLSILPAFLSHPAQKPDATCIATMGEPNFN